MYGVGANLIAIPLTTFAIMPLEAGALLLDAFGLGAPLWWLTGKAIGLLLWVAHNVADARGAVVTQAGMPTWAFGLIVFGGLWLCLWSSRQRLLGLAPVFVGVVAAWSTQAPDALVTGDGRHLAIISPDGRPMMLRERSGDFLLDAGIRLHLAPLAQECHRLVV